MSAATEEFFDGLGRRGYEPLLQRVSGTIKFEIGPDSGPKRWLVTVDHGDIAVSHRSGKADCTVQADTPVFDAVVSGTDNAIASLLRGEIIAEGNLELLQLFQRVFSGPPVSSHPAAQGVRHG